MKKQNVWLYLFALMSLLLLTLSACGTAQDDGDSPPSASPYLSPVPKPARKPVETPVPSLIPSASPIPEPKQMDTEDLEILEGPWIRSLKYVDGKLVKTTELDGEPTGTVTFYADGTFETMCVSIENESSYEESGTWVPLNGYMANFDHCYLLSKQKLKTHVLENGYVKGFTEEEIQGSTIIAHLESSPNLLVWVEDGTLKKEYYVYIFAGTRLDESVDSSDHPSSAPAATMGEENALKKAKSYLAFTAFSYNGLVEQLEYEGFSRSEAIYGADHCGADWNEQAARKAAEYLNFMAFSRQGLIEQLEYEGFTHSQAEYGVTQNGY